MLGKKVTILLLPQGSRRIKRLSIHSNLPFFFTIIGLTLFLGLLAFTLYTCWQNSHLKGQAAELKRLRKKAAQQNVQIYAFADKIRLLEEEMSKLRHFDQKLRAMTNKGSLLPKAGLLGTGGSESEVSGPKNRLQAGTEDLIRQMHRDVERLLAEASVQELSQQELAKILEDSRSIMASAPTVWPVSGSLTSGFGYRSSPFTGRAEFHRGIDIVAPVGAPIKAPAEGIVLSIEWSSGYGWILSINHGYGVVTRYAHLAQAYVEPGQRVRRGQRIAAVGRSGRTTGTHLHYEIILNGIPINPMRFLAAKD